MKYRDFDVEGSFIKAGSAIGWVVTGNGEYVIATRKGKKFFVKRNIHLRYPTKSDSPIVYDAKLVPCKALEKKQTELRKRMSGLSWEKDGIVIEEENFWDDDNKFVTVTACIPGVVSSESDFTGLSQENFVKLAINLVQRIELLHSKRVIHGDLKLKNILFKPSGASYETYLIDFDSSYPDDAIPDFEAIGGSAGYFSPEILAYASGGTDASVMTSATDIFTLGLILHRIWCGVFPDAGTSGADVAEVVLAGEPVTVNKKFNVKIGKGKGATLMSLINWMITLQPDERPTAEDVREVLQDKLEVPTRFHVGDDDKPFDDAPWDAHKFVCELLPVAELQAKGVTAFKRVNEGKGSDGLKYSVTTSAGERVLTVDEIISEGYAKRIPAEVDEAWPEHRITMSDPDVVSAKGYAKVKRVTIFFRKRYLLTTAGGRQFDKGYEWLVSEGLASVKVVASAAGEPWPEHGSIYVAENMDILGISSIERVDIAGEHRYRVTYKELVDGKPKVNESVAAKNMKLMGLIK